MVGGPPCQPYTPQRSNHGSVGCQEHHLFEATFGQGFGGRGKQTRYDSFREACETLLPHVIVLEQVMAFTKPDSQNPEFRPLEVFLKWALSYEVNGHQMWSAAKVFSEISPGPFQRLARPRRPLLVLGSHS